MYPYLRFAKEFIKFRNAPALAFDGLHVSQHMCLPWDIDPFMELNNGRTLTLLDLGRLLLAKRTGLLTLLRRKGWGMTMAGVYVRYRRRIKMFERFETRSRTIGWDDKFLYFEQSMWKRNGECANHAVYRAAITDVAGIVPCARAVAEFDPDASLMQLPDWVQSWVEAEKARPWPPM